MTSHFWPIFVDQVQTRPNHTALQTVLDRSGKSSGPIRAWTWLELEHSVRKTARTLSKLLESTGPSTRRIVHRCDNRFVDLLIWLACLRQGWVDVPIDARLPSNIQAELFLRAGGLHVESNRLDELEREASSKHSGSPDAPAESPGVETDDSLILWTTGTSGPPKGVRLSQRSLVKNAAAKLNAAPQTTEDVRLTVLPICHAYARTCDVGTWLISGSTLALDRGQSGWNRLASRVNPTLANVVPLFAKRLLDNQSSIGLCKSLRMLGCGGAALDAQTFHALTEHGITVIQGYGLTETGPVICSATHENSSPGWVGCPVDGWETKIQSGQLYVRGDSTMLGYLDDPSATLDKISVDGWLDTGDRVEVHPSNGQYQILGRSDHAINLANGYLVDPESIERQLQQCPGVMDAMVGMLDQRLIAWVRTLHTDDAMPNRLTSRAVVQRCDEILQQVPSGQRPERIFAFDSAPEQLESYRTLKGTLRRGAFLAMLEHHQKTSS